MHRAFLALFLLLAFIPAAYAQDCVGYNDSFDVRVLDAKYRPIEGAVVTVKFDRGATFGEQYFITPPKLTSANGIVHFDISNQGTLARTIDCRITINGSMGGELKTVVVEANEHGPVVDVWLNHTYPLNFYVRDQLRAPLSNASVTVGNVSLKTDANGKARFYFNTSNYSYLASYSEASQSGILEVKDDTDFEVLFAHYKIRIEVKDDNGDPLPATLTILGQTFEMTDGVFENDRVFGEAIPYSIDYKGVSKEDVIYPATDPIAEIFFDIHSPVFLDIKSETFNNRPRLTISVSDPGPFASGVDVSSVKVQYRMEPADASAPWSGAVTFTAGLNKFNAEFPELPANRIISFRIEMKDKAGNRADIDGKFTTLSEGPVNNTNTTNQTNTQNGGTTEQGIPLIYIIGGVIVAILAIYLVFRMKSKPA